MVWHWIIIWTRLVKTALQKVVCKKVAILDRPQCVKIIFFTYVCIAISEPAAEGLCGITEYRVNFANLLDYNATSCISLFTSYRILFRSAFRIQSKHPWSSKTFTLLTNIDCEEPFTLVAVTNAACKRNGDRKQLQQCLFKSEVPFMDKLTQCEFVCLCTGRCETLVIHHQYMPWTNNNPEAYRLCEVNVMG